MLVLINLQNAGAEGIDIYVVAPVFAHSRRKNLTITGYSDRRATGNGSTIGFDDVAINPARIGISRSDHQYCQRHNTLDGISHKKPQMMNTNVK